MFHVVLSVPTVLCYSYVCVLCYSHICLMWSNSVVLFGMFGVCQSYALMHNVQITSWWRGQNFEINKMHLLRSRHICTGRPQFEFITNVQLVERVRKWENVKSCKKWIKRWTQWKSKPKLIQSLQISHQIIKMGTAHCWTGQLLTTQGNQQYFWYTIEKNTMKCNTE